jgi:hypothetical protein
MLNLSTTYTGCLRVTIGILSADKKVPNDNAEFIPTRKNMGDSIPDDLPGQITCDWSSYTSVSSDKSSPWAISPE